MRSAVTGLGASAAYPIEDKFDIQVVQTTYCIESKGTYPFPEATNCSTARFPFAGLLF
jgi:hypothetical protein